MSTHSSSEQSHGDGSGQGHGSGHGHGHGDGSGHRHGHGHGDGHGQKHGHGHSHDHGDIDWGAMADMLEENGDLHLPALRQVAARLGGLFGSGTSVRRVLDIGSGPGVMTCALAEAFPDAEAVAVDGAPALLDRALARAERTGLGGRVTVRHAELPGDLEADENGLPGLGEADLIWSKQAVHHLGDQQGALDALAGTLRPGGVLAVAEGGLPMRFLPRDFGLGRPGLQARLDVVHEDWFEIMRSELPGSVGTVEDWPAMMSRAGLTEVTAFTYLVDLPAPLDPAARAFLRDHLTRMRDVMSELLDADDIKTLDVLVDPTAPEGIMRRPDVFMLSATTVVAGVRPAS
ncbi:class I SAM-dependent methyltransferase [Streptomyces sp. NPDC046821]|uniref:class I SAM-dependent methyltransferase n=1 Tax=Streptomyces sp. NPDC046821 TaxID=3154702 RepID=UPI0033D5E191